MAHTNLRTARHKSAMAELSKAEMAAMAARDEGTLISLLRAQPLTTVFWLGRDLEAMAANPRKKPARHDALSEPLPTASEKATAEEIKPILKTLMADGVVRCIDLSYRDPLSPDRPYHYYFNKDLPRGKRIFLASRTEEALHELAAHRAREFTTTRERLVVRYILVRGGLTEQEADRVINPDGAPGRNAERLQQRFLRGGMAILRDGSGRFASSSTVELNMASQSIRPDGGSETKNR